jgi:hypothetical protein
MKTATAFNAQTTTASHREAKASLPDSSTTLCLPLDSERNRRILEAECANLPHALATQRTLAGERSPKGHASARREFLFQLDEKLGLPKQWVTSTNSLANCLEQETDRSAPNLVGRALERRPEHLTDFSRDALNIYNARYFETQGAFVGLPPTYTRNTAVAIAFASHLDRLFPEGSVRIKEVCAGEGALDRWNAFFALASATRPIEVCLADLSFPSGRHHLSTLRPHAQAHSEAFDLLEPLQYLPGHERVDCMIACYGFDSVWFPEDRFVMKHDSSWYEALYRIGIPDFHRARAAVVESFHCENAMDLSAMHFAELVIERAVCDFDLDAHTSLATPLVERLGGTSRGSLSVPGGLVRWVTEAFATQLKSTGRMIIADAGTYDPRSTSIGGFLDTGCPALGRVIDFHLAETLLKSAGFDVTVRSLEEFAHASLGRDWRDFGSDDETAAIRHPNQYVMEISAL